MYTPLHQNKQNKTKKRERRNDERKTYEHVNLKVSFLIEYTYLYIMCFFVCLYVLMDIVHTYLNLVVYIYIAKWSKRTEKFKKKLTITVWGKYYLTVA